MFNLIKKLVPDFLKILFNQYQNKRKYDVIFGKGATASRTVFEGKNLMNNNASISSSYVGTATYISGYTSLSKVKIGRFCSIGQNVKNSLGIHPVDFVSTHPAFFSTKKQAGFTFVKNNEFKEHKFADENNKYLVVIGNDVWIGNNVVIMDGVTIGDGAIIGTGAVVTKDVLPYSIVGGVPAKLIRYRFNEITIRSLLSIKWWDKNIDWIKTNSLLFLDENEFVKNVNK